MVTALVEPEIAPHVTSRSAEHVAMKYLMILLSVGIVMYLLPFLMERLTVFQPFSVSDWGNVLDHSYNLAGTDADIVIFGDSSALYGIDTPRLSAELGLRVINLPQSIGSLVIMGDLPLRRYLSQNKTPRIILLYMTPWNRDFNAVPDVHAYEGTEQLVRHGTASELRHLLRTRPREILSFPLSFYLVGSSSTRLWNPGGIHFTPNDGFLPYRSTIAGPIAGDCAIPPQLLNLTSDRTLQQLQNSFRPTGARIVTMLAPIPNCAGAKQIANRLGASLMVLPSYDFADDTFLVHPIASHSAETTDRVAAELRKWLAAPR
jgi:hypothetical protein